MAEAKTTKAVRAFLKEVNEEIITGRAAERSYYPAIERLVEAFAPNINAQIEQAGEASTPDFGVERRKNRIGFIEVKEQHVSLDDVEKAAAAGRPEHNAEQFNRYLGDYDNLLYTNLLEWRRFRHHAGEAVQTAVIATLGGDGKLHLNRDGLDDFERLIGTFLAAKPEPQTTAKGLALEMARLTKVLDVNTQKALAGGDDYLKGLFDVFQKELIHGLKTDEFADMYAQTVAYGLFTARVMQGGDGDFNRRIAGELLPKTNPFLRRVFKSLVDADNMPDSLVWIVEDLAQLIEAARMEEIVAELARFGERRRKGEEVVEHDPIIYFYEHFLRAYDPKKAKQRGVYYTPLPVVSYIVRSIDELLKSEFDMPLGLADKNVVILDPACGTGTFLYEVVRLIHERMAGRGPAYWKNEYVPGLLKRLFGFELLMAPYTIAHLKLAELLRDTGYEFAEGQRLGVYLTNTLEKAEQHAEQTMLPGIMGAISTEKELADSVKAEEPVMVVLGNPPYALYGRMNINPWISSLLDDYKKGLREKKINIDDDFIKFIRFGQWRIERTGYGILGFISNNTYIDGITHRRMRESLLETFGKVNILNLHGSSLKAEECPDGSKDENVFDIRQGVAIGLFTKKERGNADRELYYGELWGKRFTDRGVTGKYVWLNDNDINTTDWTLLKTEPYYYFFVPKSEEGLDPYGQYFGLNDIFEVSQNGVQTDRDSLVFDDSKTNLEERMKAFYGQEGLRTNFVEKYNIKASSSYDILDKRQKTSFDPNAIKRCLYRPFNIRWLYYKQGFTSRPAFNVMKHMQFGNNIGLISVRQVAEEFFNHVFVSSTIVERRITTSNRGCAFFWPIYLYSKLVLGNTTDDIKASPNFKTSFIDGLLPAIGASSLENSPEVGMRSGSREVLYPEDIFYYIYGVLHSPTYRTRYAEFLKIDFPRIPLPKNYESFDALAAAGEKLAGFHLLKDKANWDWRGIGQRPGGGTDTTVGKVEYDEKNQDVIFDAKKPPKEQVRVGPVPKHIWEFHVGGYQVLQKWLKDRKGREVSLGDYVPIIVALAETDRIMKEEIDPVFKEMLGIS